MQHAEVARDKPFNIRVSAEEWQRLEALAKHYGLNVASTIRFLAKRDADALGITAAPVQAKPTKKGAKKP